MSDTSAEVLKALRLEMGLDWRPIKDAPAETQIWVGRWFFFEGKDPEWRMCESGLYFDAGINTPDAYEPSYWYWAEDNDSFGVTDADGPTHWLPLPTPPNR